MRGLNSIEKGRIDERGSDSDWASGARAARFGSIFGRQLLSLAPHGADLRNATGFALRTFVDTHHHLSAEEDNFHGRQESCDRRCICWSYRNW